LADLSANEASKHARNHGLKLGAASKERSESRVRLSELLGLDQLVDDGRVLLQTSLDQTQLLRNAQSLGDQSLRHLESDLLQLLVLLESISG